MMQEKQIKSTQDWLNIKILNTTFNTKINNSILVNKQNELIGIFKITPIKYNLKSELEKKAILKNYNKFFVNIDIDCQIVIINKKINIDEQKESIFRDNKNIAIKEQYFNYIKRISELQRFSLKEYYIIFKTTDEDINIQLANMENTYNKAAELLERCGNHLEVLKENELLTIFEYFIRNEYEL